MNLATIDWLIIFSVPILAVLASYLYKKRFPGAMSRRGFGLGNQQLGGVAVASTYVGANITFTSIFIILSQEGYKRGYWALTIPLFWLIGTGVFLLLYSRIRDYIVQGKTLHQAIGETFQSKSIKFYASIGTIIAFVLTVGLEFYGGIKLISAANVPLLSYVSIGILFIIIVGYFTARGGFGGVAYTDIALDVITLAGILVLLSGIFSFIWSLFTSSFPIITSQNDKIIEFPSIGENIIFTISMVILFLPFQFCTFDSWQRLSARKDRESSPNWLISFSGLLVGFCFCIPIILGMYLRSKNVFVDVENNQLVLFEFLKYQSFQPIWIGLIFAGFIAAVFSTADELLNCCSYSFLSDTIEVNENNSEEGKTTLNYSYKFYVIVFCIISAIFAFIGLWKEKEITDVGLAVFSTQIVFILPLIFVFFKVENANKYVKRVKFSMIAGFTSSMLFVGLGWIIKEKSLIEAAPIGALIVEILCFLVLSLFIRN